MKRLRHKKSDPAEKKQYMFHWLVEFLVGFVGAALIAFLLVNVFDKQVYNFIVNIVGL